MPHLPFIGDSQIEQSWSHADHKEVDNLALFLAERGGSKPGGICFPQHGRGSDDKTAMCRSFDLWISRVTWLSLT